MTTTDTGTCGWLSRGRGQSQRVSPGHSVTKVTLRGRCPPGVTLRSKTAAMQAAQSPTDTLRPESVVLAMAGDLIASQGRESVARAATDETAPPVGTAATRTSTASQRAWKTSSLTAHIAGRGRTVAGTPGRALSGYLQLVVAVDEGQVSDGVAIQDAHVVSVG